MEIQKNILSIIYKNSHLLHFISHKQLFNNYFNQIGGNYKKLKLNYNNHKYIFEESSIDKDHYILSSYDNIHDCIIVIINKEKKVAEIHGIGNYKNCVNVELSNTSVGSHLLKLTIKMLQKYKDKLNIDQIILTDNSIKSCDKINIKLSKMLILINGDTWYGKYGFRPFEYNDKSQSYIIHNKRNKYYNNNIRIMNKITISDIDLIKYIKVTNKELLINKTQELLKFKPNYLLKNYINELLQNYDKSCKYFYLFYEKLFDDISLFDFNGITFGLQI